MVIREDPAELRAEVDRIKATNPALTREILAGSVEQIVEHCRAYDAIGFHHFIYHCPAPHDVETLERFAREVRPAIG